MDAKDVKFTRIYTNEEVSIPLDSSSFAVKIQI